ncbi:hypothetical protein GUJ93_ZPchr0012g21973 [Zizania palustris]|uniref:Uncharacterized protein n=1 Tax=Zizania palustris TaxID=103762 RepID=A0A8J5WP76_ZIZPA|nr:hypothetical protein GUJ93_ZPchr0012g21973 [Zizania palustris]
MSDAVVRPKVFLRDGSYYLDPEMDVVPHSRDAPLSTIARVVEGKADEGEEIKVMPSLLERVDQDFYEAVAQGANDNSDEEDEEGVGNNDNEEEYIVISNKWKAQDSDALSINEGRDTCWEYRQNEVLKDAVYPTKEAV